MKDILYILDTIIDKNKVLYVSTPITTGERYIDWYTNIGREITDSEEQKRSKQSLVIEPNIKNSCASISRIRRLTKKAVIDPTVLEDCSLNWEQGQYYEFWTHIIRKFADEIVFLDGWEYSLGCCHELITAAHKGISMFTQNLQPMTIFDAIAKVQYSICRYREYNMAEASNLQILLQELKELSQNEHFYAMLEDRMKDEKLNFLVDNNIANVAQFISFEPYLGDKPRYIHINGFNDASLSTKEIIEKLITSSTTKQVNIRNFSRDTMKGNKLIYGKQIGDIDEIINIIKENSAAGKYSIVNENISIKDSGVSGVVLGDIIEFSPGDTPKCVDKEGVCSLPRAMGLKILMNVYGFTPELDYDPSFRVEFSIHPTRQGVGRKHTIVWEYEHFNNLVSVHKIIWPNNFSKFIGDKAFGLLVADTLGFLVPETTVIARNVTLFTFGVKTGLKEKWIRTCPVTKEPGKYYTGKAWSDPFLLMFNEEAKGVSDNNSDSNLNKIASILSQDSIEAQYSGAAFIRAEKKDDIIEGVKGNGDDFMVGKRNAEVLPATVITAVVMLNDQIRKYNELVGDVSIEWVYDGTEVWIVQMNQLKFGNSNDIERSIIVNGNPERYEKVYVTDGLDVLRSKIELFMGMNIGIELVGNIGITSHFGDLLRQANIPSVISSI